MPLLGHFHENTCILSAFSNDSPNHTAGNHDFRSQVNLLDPLEATFCLYLVKHIELGLQEQLQILEMMILQIKFYEYTHHFNSFHLQNREIYLLTYKPLGATKRLPLMPFKY